MNAHAAKNRPEAARHWTLDPEVIFLNHGSFGACPAPVLEAQSVWRQRLERQPVQFLARDLEGLLDEALEALGVFIGASAEDLAFVPNVTAGVNAVVRSLRFEPGDELLTTSHEYNACRCALEFVASRSGARVVVADIPFPIQTPDEAFDAVLRCVSPATKLALVDHVTSPTAMILPIKRIVEALAARGVDTFVDGAHAPGMTPLDVTGIDAAYYSGNCHKWMCAPKGAGFLHVRRDRQDGVRPTSISHGYNSSRSDRSRFRLQFGWTGTADPTAALCAPVAIRFMASLKPGGWDEVRACNHALALRGREIVCESLGVEPPCPDEMIGSFAAAPLPDGLGDPPASSLYADPLQEALLERFNVEAPVLPWPAPPRRLVRLSAQLYNTEADYHALARALRYALEDERQGNKHKGG